MFNRKVYVHKQNKKKNSTIIKRTRYNQSELSNPNPSIFFEYLRTLPQRVEHHNIYTGPYSGVIAPAWWASGPNLSAHALRYYHKSHFLSQSGLRAKLSRRVTIRVYEKIYPKFKPQNITIWNITCYMILINQTFPFTNHPQLIKGLKQNTIYKGDSGGVCASLCIIHKENAVEKL